MAVQKPLVVDNGTTQNLPAGDQLDLGAYALPATDGASGDVITTDGAGNATWSAPTGGPPSGAAGPTYLSGTYPDPDVVGLGQKVLWLVEGGKYATLQAAFNAASEGDTIMVGPKATGTWGDLTIAENKTMSIVGMNGPQGKTAKIGAVTFSPTTGGLNINRNEYFFANVMITGSFASQAVLFSGTGAGRMRFVGCYVDNTSATGDGVVNSNTFNTGSVSSLYLDNCVVQVVTTTGVGLRHSGQYTWIKNRTQIEGGLHAIEQTAGSVDIVGASIVANGALSTVELSGTASLTMGYSTISNSSDAAGAIGVNVNSATAFFGAGDATIAVGSSGAAAGTAVAGSGTFAYTNVSFAYVTTLTVTTKTPAANTIGTVTTPFAATAGVFTTALDQVAAAPLSIGPALATVVNVTPRLNAATIDRATAGAMNVGTTTATSLTIGSTAASLISLTTNATTGTVSVSPKLAVNAIDRSAAGTLAIGSTFANLVTLQGLNIGKGNGAVATATALGVSALAANTGANNTAIGYQAGDAIVGGFANTCAGSNSLGSLTTGNQNTAVGFSAGSSVVSASNLTAVGYQALNVATATNTAVGASAGVALTSGTNNVLMGPSTLGAATTATRNVAVGSAAGGGASGVAAGVAHADSVAIGNNAGIGTTSTGQNTVVGANGGATTITTGTNLTVLGYNASPSAATASNEVTLGNSSVTTLRCAVNTITLISDQRDKADTQDLTLGMDFLSTIRPVQFKWDRREWYATPILDDEGNVIGQTPGVSDGTKKQDKFEAGFIAQELDAAQTAANAEWMGLALKNNPDRMEATPLRLFPVVVKACQELHAKNQQLEARLAALEAAFAAKT